MCGRCKWCQNLSLDPLFGARQKIECSRRRIVCAQRPQADGKRRRHSPVAVCVNTQLFGVGSGRLRENAVSRHQQATYLLLITVRSQNMRCGEALVMGKLVSFAAAG